MAFSCESALKPAVSLSSSALNMAGSRGGGGGGEGGAGRCADNNYNNMKCCESGQIETTPSGEVIREGGETEYIESRRGYIDIMIKTKGWECVTQKISRYLLRHDGHQ